MKISLTGGITCTLKNNFEIGFRKVGCEVMAWTGLSCGCE